MTEGERPRLSDEEVLEAVHTGFWDELLALLYEVDPMRLNYGVNPDEYKPEVKTILPRLPEASTPEECQRIVHEEFVRWFDQSLAGPPERYEAAGRVIWEAWQEYLVRRGRIG
jgi:hypothetical protein